MWGKDPPLNIDYLTDSQELSNLTARLISAGTRMLVMYESKNQQNYECILGGSSLPKTT